MGGGVLGLYRVQVTTGTPQYLSFELSAEG